jgi:DNA-directed RNA polymerase subunit RPC12/RpoP
LRKTFSSREELLELLRLIKWAEGKCGVEAEGKWGTVVIMGKNMGIPHDTFKNPTQLTIYLDRNLDKQIFGFMYVHGPLNSYLGFGNEDPYCEHFNLFHRAWQTRSEASRKACEEQLKKKGKEIVEPHGIRVLIPLDYKRIEKKNNKCPNCGYNMLEEYDMMEIVDIRAAPPAFRLPHKIKNAPSTYFKVYHCLMCGKQYFQTGKRPDELWLYECTTCKI